MFQHSLLLIYRNFLRFKSSFFINLLGLSTGLACTLLIYLWVRDEWNVDKFHEKDSQLYQVMESQQHAESIRVTNSTPGLLAETLAEEMPEVEYAATVTPSYWFEKFTLSVGDNAIKATGQYAGQDFFNIFSYDLIQGDESQVLADKSAIVLSEELALNLFKTTENIIGKTVVFQHEKQFLVSGIFKGTPPTSSDQFDFALSFEVWKEQVPGIANWDNSGPNTFVVLKKGTRIDQFNSKIANLIQTKSKDIHRTLFLTPYSDNYLYGNYENGIQAGGRIDYVKLFSLIALFILIIACINFMNLSTAKASRRIKEIGIKKVVGADRKTLIFQYLGESILLTFLSLFLALIIVEGFLPQFNQITGKQLSLQYDAKLVLSVISITLFTGLVAGSYPALYLSGFHPATVLKGKLPTSAGEVWGRKGLVVFQFSLSVILLVSVLVVYKQIEYVQTKNIGYDKDNILYFEREGRLKENLEAFLTEMKNIPGVENASSIGQSMVGGGNTTKGLDWPGKNPDDIISFAVRPVNHDIIEMLGIEMKEGRPFSRNFSTDTAKIIFNEAAIQVMGLQDPVGKIVNIQDQDMEIAGVTKDFHFESLHANVGPLLFLLKPEWTQKIMVKVQAGKERETIAKLQQVYEDFNPGFVFDFRFLDQDYQAQYAAEQRVAVLSRYFAGLAILICCLGLYGLAAFAAEQRTKELGIRKVLGASVASIIRLLSKDFLKLVLVAIVVGSAVSWVAMNKWLQDFAYKVDLEWGVFGVAGALALVIALITVSFQAVKAALMNPVKSLRSE